MHLVCVDFCNVYFWCRGMSSIFAFQTFVKLYFKQFIISIYVKKIPTVVNENINCKGLLHFKSPQLVLSVEGYLGVSYLQNFLVL